VRAKMLEPPKKEKEVKFTMSVDLTAEKAEETLWELEISVARVLGIGAEYVEIQILQRRRLRRVLGSQTKVEVVVQTDDDSAIQDKVTSEEFGSELSQEFKSMTSIEITVTEAALTAKPVEEEKKVRYYYCSRRCDCCSSVACLRGTRI